MAFFSLVVLSTFPVVIPFILMQNAVAALRLSNAIAIAMLFVARLCLRPVSLDVAHGYWGLPWYFSVFSLVGLTKTLGG